MKFIIRFTLGFFIGMTLALACLRLGHAEQRYVPTVEKTIDSVVAITAVYMVPVKDGKKVKIETHISMGAGVIVSTNGHILTCQHVIDGSPVVLKVSLHSAPTNYLNVVVLRRDFARDLALLKINLSTPMAVPKIAAKSPSIGEEVIAIGHPEFLYWSVTAGIVSGLNREGLAVNLLQTDAAINHGNSGGPLFNLRGEIIGINESGIMEANNLGFAVSVEEIRAFLSVFRGLDQVF